ncbi:MAG: bifunctional glutamate N-acetyltransferase/amino-acid acetyltransferase ArgJ [Nitrospirae bacterium]|nr:MAG: bifunctional glutamate N-acetyltransferase/amino-acid acetyltransferase ArgJ [Nitrospirota bacterium]
MTGPSFKNIRGGITAPQGFLAAGLHSGIKKQAAPDLALVVSAREGSIAGVFTTNRVVAAPVVLDRAHLRGGIGRAIVVNSGNANACTGARGLADAKEMARLVAGHLGTTTNRVFVGSTGVIGQPLPMARIREGIPAAVKRLRRGGGREAARAIMTTDLTVKEVAVTARIAGHRITVGGMAKGSGMIHPDMATMLAYLTTDAAIAPPTLQQALVSAVAPSFNSISVDGDTSTNDTVLCLANGLAENPLLKTGSRELAAFQELLSHACHSLAMHICRDGEGVTKVVRLLVTRARTQAEAKQVAKTIATSSLVKTALFGEDANWGRIMAAIGRSGVPIAPQKIGLAFEGIPIVRNGVGLGPSAERRIDRVVRRKEFTITVDLGQGSHCAWLWTTDLSYDYVKINASYRS